MALKLKFRTQFPASVLVEPPILLDKTGSVYTFSIDIDALLPYLGLGGFEPKDDVIQIVAAGAAVVLPDTTLLVIERAAPALTTLALPAMGTSRLRILDWSTAVTDHEIRMTPHGSETIMKAATYSAFSNAAQLASLTLHPSAALGGWYIAP